MKKRVFDAINRNWEDKVTDSEDLCGAVGRPTDNEKLHVIIEDLVSKLDLQSGDELLEVGCGTGVLLSLLKKSIQSACGLDYSKEAIKLAREAFPDIDFEAGEAGVLPYEDDRFSKTVCYSVFHYFTNLDYAYKAINEMLRVTCPGGKILLGDIPSKAHFHLSPYYRKFTVKEMYYRIMRVVIRVIKRREKTPPMIDPRKWIWYDLESLVKYIEPKGHSARILEQPQIIQWHEVTYNHRFDILIEKGTTQ